MISSINQKVPLWLHTWATLKLSGIKRQRSLLSTKIVQNMKKANTIMSKGEFWRKQMACQSGKNKRRKAWPRSKWLTSAKTHVWLRIKSYQPASAVSMPVLTRPSTGVRCEEHKNQEKICGCLDQKELISCLICEPLLKDKASKGHFFIPALVFMIINVLVWVPVIIIRLKELQQI